MSGFRLKVAIICTVLFAGSWCLAQTPSNLFWLSLSRETYLKHIGIWLGILLFIYLALSWAGNHSHEAENRLALFFAAISPLNLLDYGMRSIFGEVSKWPKQILLIWAVISVLIFLLAVFAALRVHITRNFLHKAIQVAIPPCILLFYYAIPSEFIVLNIYKPRKNGDRPPIHLILFDMLSYEFLLNGSTISAHYPNFEAFSHEADVFTNTYAPGSSTAATIPRLVTGIDFVEVRHPTTQWIGRTNASTQMLPISSFESLFSSADKYGYDIFLRGFALPYLNNFGDHIQSGRTFAYNSLWRLGMHSLIWPILSPGGIQHQQTVDSMLQEYLTRIRRDSRNTLFYTHWNIPHDPFIYDQNGHMLNRIELIKQMITTPDREEKYKHQLRGTDAVFGQLIQAMKESGTYDKSLVIVTSDHNIAGFGFDMKRVPLFIKRPHQRSPRIIHSTVTTLKCVDYIESFIRYGNLENTLLRINQPEWPLS
ncbi:MAG: sulfatase-like hydrolase/transferase [Candidatus Heimdallarchaeota archaeon]